MTNWKHRDVWEEECSAPRCRGTHEISYLQGATIVNPDKRIQLCGSHHEEFLREVREAALAKSFEEAKANG